METHQGLVAGCGPQRDDVRDHLHIVGCWIAILKSHTGKAILHLLEIVVNAQLEGGGGIRRGSPVCFTAICVKAV